MKLSRGKINALSQTIISALLMDDRIELFAEDNDIRLNIVDTFTNELAKDENIDQKVRQSLNNYTRRVREGSQEWDLLYQKHYQEEEKKRRGI